MRNSILSLLLAFFLNILCARGFNNPKKLHIGRPFTLQLKASNFDDFVAAASKTSKSPSLPNRHQSNEKRISYVSSIRSQNLARVNAAKDGNEIVINFGNVDDFNNMMVVVSGESGSGKSLLVSKVAELLTGSKVVPSLLYSTEKPKPTESVASVQMDFRLYGSHVSVIRSTLEKLNLDAGSIFGNQLDMAAPLHLSLKRSFFKSEINGRIKSSCKINGLIVTLKALKAIGGPMLAIVNAPMASMALGKSHSRMTMFDAGIPSEIIVFVRQLQREYNKCRKKREKLEKELQSRVLPASINVDADRDIELFDHWVEELDGFEARVDNFCKSLSSQSFFEESPLQKRIEALEGLKWTDSDGDGDNFSSTLYSELLEILDYLKALDARIESAVNARDALASLSSPDSARTALDRTRQLLVDASTEAQGNRAFKSAERTHELLNLVEDALSECASFFDNDSGLPGILESERSSCQLSSDDINAIIFEWKTLSRKHGVSAHLLPLCHTSLRQELDGNIEAKKLLPEAIENEREALQELRDGTKVLSQARKNLAKRISKSITGRLPLLGMENSSFEAHLRPIDEPSYSTALGVEEIDFLLLHDNAEVESKGKGHKETRGGSIDLVASSGEKARILLAIECEIPGSVRALCGTAPLLYDEASTIDDDTAFTPPVAVIYDEIDAHVGGRASVSVAKMLSDQSRSCQVLAITHSPSVAAIADLHVCVNKQSPSEDGKIITSAEIVEGSSRRKELARMASGDMAMKEAEIFADALIREVAKKN